MAGVNDIFLLDASQEKDQIKKLRTALLNYDECCQKYIEAEDEKLLGILRIKNFDVERSAEAIKRYENFLIKHIRNVSLEDCRRAFHNDVMCLLKHRDPGGSQILYVKAKKFRPDEIPLETMYTAGFLLLDEMLRIKETQINGLILIFNIKDVGYIQLAKQIASIRILDIQRANIFASKGGSIIKIKSVYALNSPVAVVKVYKALKVIVSKKIKERMRICDLESDEFNSNFRKECLPLSLGGILNEEDAKDYELMNTVLFKLEKSISKTNSAKMSTN